MTPNRPGLLASTPKESSGQKLRAELLTRLRCTVPGPE